MFSPRKEKRRDRGIYSGLVLLMSKYKVDGIFDLPDITERMKEAGYKSQSDLKRIPESELERFGCSPILIDTILYVRERHRSKRSSSRVSSSSAHSSSRLSGRQDPPS